MKLHTQATASLLGLFSLPAMAATVLVDFAGVAYTPAALIPTAALLNNTVTTFDFNYDVTGAGLGGAAAVLRVNVTSVLGGTRNLTTGGGNGISVQGGNVTSGNGWWESAEDLQFTVSLRDAADADVTSSYTLDLTSTTLRWGGAGAGTANFSVDTITGPAATAVTTFPLSIGQTAETSFLATRTTATIAQISGMGFEIGNAIPEPSSALLLGLSGLAFTMVRRRK